MEIQHQQQRTAQTRTYIHTYTHTHIHTYVSYIHTYICTCVSYIHIHTYIHTYIHTKTWAQSRARILTQTAGVDQAPAALVFDLPVTPTPHTHARSCMRPCHPVHAHPPESPPAGNPTTHSHTHRPELRARHTLTYFPTLRKMLMFGGVYSESYGKTTVRQ